MTAKLGSLLKFILLGTLLELTAGSRGTPKGKLRLLGAASDEAEEAAALGLGVPGTTPSS